MFRELNQLRNRKILIGSIIISLLAFFILATCSSDSPTDSVNDGSTSELDTITVTPAVTESAAMDYIPISGIPSGNDSIYAVITPVNKSNSVINSQAALSDTAYSIIFETDSGVFLLSPIHPSNPTGGGQVQIVLTDSATVISKPFIMSIDSLPSAPGEFLAIVSLLQSLFDEKLRLLGITRDDLNAFGAGNDPIDLIALALAYDVIDSPENPNSLKAIAEGTAPILIEESVDIDILDRIFGQSGFRENLEDHLNGLDTLEIESKAAPPSKKLLAGDVVSSFGASCIPGPDFGINNCGDLAIYMQEAATEAKIASSAVEKVKKDYIAAALLVTKLFPPLSPVSTIAGSTIWAEAKVREGRMGLYPTAFVDGVTWFDASITEFPEDFVDYGGWTEFLVSAESEGWVLDKVLIESIFKSISAGKLLNKAKNGNLPRELLGDFEENVGKIVKSKNTNYVFKEIASESDLIEICPNSWDDIDCAHHDYSTAVISSGPYDANTAGKWYYPTDIGEGILRIETKPIFGDNQTGFAVELSTDPLEIFLDPFQAVADTGEEMTFHVRVENAQDDNVSYTLSEGSIIVSSKDSVKIKTPSTPWDPAMELTAVSTSRTGLLENTNNPPSDIAYIAYDSAGTALIVPGGKCVKKGETQDFTVLYDGGDIESVQWSLNPPDFGSLSFSGTTATYSAPTENSGSAVITAIVNGNSEAVAFVNVSACICNWNFEAYGSGHVYSASGEWATTTDLGAILVYLNETEDDPDGRPLVSFGIYDFNGPDIYQTDAFGFEDTDYITWGFSDTTQQKPTIEITGYSFGDFIEGFAYGTLTRRVMINPPEYESITFTMSFRAEFFDINRPQCVDD